MKTLRRLSFSFGCTLQELGLGFDRIGSRIYGYYPFKEQLSRHRRVMHLFDKHPLISSEAFIAPSASVIGQVKLGRSAIWHGAVIRGDVNNIEIGDNTDIGCRNTIHVSSGFNRSSGAYPTIIGSNVSVGDGALIHACTLEDGCVIGDGAIVMDGAVVEKGSIVAEGSLVSAKKRVSAGQYWSGSPAKFVRNVSPEDLESVAKSRASRAKRIEEHKAAERQAEQALAEYHKTASRPNK